MAIAFNRLKKIVSFVVVFTIISCSNAQKTEFSEEALTTLLETTNESKISFEKSLEKHRGKIVLAEIWATWCSDCIKAMPKINQLQSQHPEIDYLFISVDKSAEKWKKGIAKYGLKGDHLLAKDQMRGSFGKSIDLNWIPRYIIIDQTGKIALYKAIETDFELINQTLIKLKNKQ